MDVRVGLWRRLSAEELMLLNCGVGEDSWESLWLQAVHSERDQPWKFFGRNDAKAETPVLLPPHAKSWLIGKDSDAGRDWGQEEKGTTEDEMAGWHPWMDGSMDMSLSELQELVMDREAWRAAIHGVTKSRTGLSDWTELNWRHLGPWSGGYCLCVGRILKEILRFLCWSTQSCQFFNPGAVVKGFCRCN